MSGVGPLHCARNPQHESLDLLGLLCLALPLCLYPRPTSVPLALPLCPSRSLAPVAHRIGPGRPGVVSKPEPPVRTPDPHASPPSPCSRKVAYTSARVRCVDVAVCVAVCVCGCVHLCLCASASACVLLCVHLYVCCCVCLSLCAHSLLGVQEAAAMIAAGEHNLMAERSHVQNLQRQQKEQDKVQHAGSRGG